MDRSDNSENQNSSGYTADDSSTGIGRLTDFEDSENDDTEPNSESKSETTVVSVSRVDPKSIDSSTDTLVADIAGGGLVDTAKGDAGKKVIRGDRILPKTDVAVESNPVDGHGKTDIVHTHTPINLGLLDNSNSLLIKRRAEGVEATSKRNGGCVVPTHEEFHSGRGKSKSVGGDSQNGDTPLGEDGIPEPTLPVHCEVCATSRRLLGDVLSASVHGNTNPSSNNNIMTSTTVPSVISPSNVVLSAGCADASKISSSNTPMHSRTPSTGVPVTPDDHGVQTRSVSDRHLQDIALGHTCAPNALRSAFDVDGLSSLHDEVQNRLNMIVNGYKVSNCSY